MMGIQLAEQVTDSDFSIGPSDARLTLLEYGDYDCVHCRKANAIVEAIRSNLGNRLRFVYRPLPRNTRDSLGMRAAEAALAADAQGRFWEMHQLLLSPQTTLNETVLLQFPSMYPSELQLDEERFVREVTSGVYRDRVNDFVRSGVESGVLSTPTFFINGLRHDDYWDIETLQAALDQAEVTAI
jgi:protein-disulfide isomerase